jgi:methanogenic corrinoid protein MtbC1
VVLGVVSGDTHGLGVHVLADLLRGDGFRVHDLGTDTPAEAFVETASAAERLVGIAVASYVTGRDRHVRQSLRALRAAGCRAPIVVGGHGIASDAAARSLGADAYAPDMVSACRFFAAPVAVR